MEYRLLFLIQQEIPMSLIDNNLRSMIEQSVIDWTREAITSEELVVLLDASRLPYNLKMEAIEHIMTWEFEALEEAQLIAA